MSPARNEYPSHNQQRGIALLVMLAIILVAFTTVAISRLSLNSGEQKARAKTTQALMQSKEAIMAAAIAIASGTTPPGFLPCPDTDGDGSSDRLPSGLCTPLGLVPFVSLGIEQPLDGAGAPIWYAVSAEYSRAPNSSPVYNSSTKSLLKLNTRNMAFMLFSSNDPLSGQTRPSVQARRNPPASSAAQYIEAGGANQYLDVKDATHNDIVMGISALDFWADIEGAVLHQAGGLIREYRNACGIYPWPANYTPSATSNDSNNSNSLYEGLVPFGAALPSGWGLACPAPNISQKAPLIANLAWLSTHWKSLIYYAICKKPVSPTNPPKTKCLSLDAGNIAEAILISPGSSVASQNRITSPDLLTSYFENDNVTLNDNKFNQIKPVSDSFNDRIYIIN